MAQGHYEGNRRITHDTARYRAMPHNHPNTNATYRNICDFWRDLLGFLRTLCGLPATSLRIVLRLCAIIILRVVIADNRTCESRYNAVVTPLRKVATYEPRIKDTLRKSKRNTQRCDHGIVPENN